VNLVAPYRLSKLTNEKSAKLVIAAPSTANPSPYIDLIGQSLPMISSGGFPWHAVNAFVWYELVSAGDQPSLAVQPGIMFIQGGGRSPYTPIAVQQAVLGQRVDLPWIATRDARPVAAAPFIRVTNALTQANNIEIKWGAELVVSDPAFKTRP